MLAWLSIQGLAVVDKLELNFHPELNVLTGETGAGKSLILGSISLLLGERADPEWLRSGEARGFVEGAFDLSSRPDLVSALGALDVEPDEDRVILRREIASDGRSRAVVNGRTVLLPQLRASGDLLVDLHGQHEHQLLLRPESQADFYDAWAGILEHRKTLQRERSAILDELRELREDRAAWAERRSEEDRIREDLAELAAAALSPGEEEILKSQRERLRHRERLLESLKEARHALAAEDGGAEGNVRRAVRALRSLAATVPEQESLVETAEKLLDALREATQAIEDAEARATEDPLPLEEVEERLDRIHRLTRKHRVDFSGLLELHADLETRARSLDPDGRGLDERAAAVQSRMAEFERGVDRIVEQRRAHQARFERDIGGSLARLGFQKALLTAIPSESTVDRSRPAVDPTMIPGLEFQFRPNSGEPARPLKRIASGGELSRVMLAVKSLMADKDQVAVLVFDEVDQGLGGAAGEAVGQMLRAIGTRRQVLCITHLPLIAAQGSRHLEVVKTTSRGRTTTGVRTLTGKLREEEIARLLAGSRVSETTRRQARELLAAVERGADTTSRSRRAAAGGS